MAPVKHYNTRNMELHENQGVSYLTFPSLLLFHLSSMRFLPVWVESAGESLLR